MLLAEAGGARGYIITFDQSRGGLADLIDTLQDRYGFEHYTRYSRIGILRPGQAFEAFYREFMADLGEILSAALVGAVGQRWEQIEITVQQISLCHRHDFVADAEDRLKARLPKGASFTKVFRPPVNVLHTSA